MKTPTPITHAAPPLLSVRDVTVALGHGLTRTDILKGISFDVPAGSVLGLVGESGSGKSTLAKTIVGGASPAGGAIVFDGADITRASRAARRRLHRTIQLIPQDPYSSLNPRMTIEQTLAEALDPRFAIARSRRDEIVTLLESVSLDAVALRKYPHEFSGGQRQRIAIARALAVRPRLIIADEITSALDLSTQAEILLLLERLQAETGVTMIFISHNLAVVQRLSDAVMVLLHGEIVEHGEVDQVFDSPASAYTRTLIASVPGQG